MKVIAYDRLKPGVTMQTQLSDQTLERADG